MLLIGRIESYFSNFPIQLGGPGIIVKCDETMLNYKVKSHRGHGPREQVWALLFVETSIYPSRIFIELLNDKKKTSIIPIIARVVRPGSIIYTDEWSSYNDLALFNNYQYLSVTHKYNFVCPGTGVHTQHVESTNNK
jgi:transposase-like protein